jgi:molybdate transport system regulatory protein
MDSLRNSHSPNLTVHSNLWLEADGCVALSSWRVQLLEAIAATGSIRAAAAQMKITYALAWHRVDEMERALGVPLVDRQRGGPKGGSAQLTGAGLDCLERFNRFAALAGVSVRQHFEDTFGKPDAA